MAFGLSSKRKCSVVGWGEFSCPDKGAFSFKYPVFRGWEVKAVEKKSADAHIIWINWPDSIDFEVPPQIRVNRMDCPVVLSDSFKKNPQGTLYDYVHDLSLYVKDYVPKKGSWDYLEFYSNEFLVRISRFSCEEFGFDGDAFYKEIVNSFSFED